MDIIKTIKAEIERLYNGEAPKHDQQCNFDDGCFVGIDAIAQFLDSLESEKPMNQDELDFQTFAKEMNSVFALPKERTINTEENPLNWEYEIARHFYELGKGDRDTIFHEGMMYYRKQMTQEAVEGRIYKDEYAEQAPFYYVSSELFNLSPNMMNGDKVRIVVLKTEE